MKTLIALSAVLFASPSFAGELSQKDRESIVKYYEATRDKFLASVKGVSEAQARFKAAPERWSVAEVAEHIALAETAIRARIDTTILSTKATPEKQAEVKGKDELVVKVLTDRTSKFKAPEGLVPQHKFGTLEETVKAYQQGREANLEFLKTTKADLRSHFGPSPMGPLDAYQWMLFLAAHSARHTAQLEEVKADPGYPKN